MLPVMVFAEEPCAFSVFVRKSLARKGLYVHGPGIWGVIHACLPPLPPTPASPMGTG